MIFWTVDSWVNSKKAMTGTRIFLLLSNITGNWIGPVLSSAGQPENVRLATGQLREPSVLALCDRGLTRPL